MTLKPGNLISAHKSKKVVSIRRLKFLVSVDCYFKKTIHYYIQNADEIKKHLKCSDIEAAKARAFYSSCLSLIFFVNNSESNETV